MRRGSIFVILFVIVAAVVIGASQFLRSQPPMEITIAVDPLTEPWVSNVVAGLNATNPVVNATRRIQFRVTTVEDLDVWNGSTRWTTTSHPAAWIPASSASTRYAIESGLSLVEVTPSLARTPLVWGGYVSRVNVLTEDGSAPLDWESVQSAAESESWSRIGGSADWGFLKLGFAQPGRKMAGLAVLFSGAANFGDAPDLNGGAVRSTDFRDWMLPIVESVPNFATLGGDPGSAMARGPSTVEIALLPEVQWLTNLSGLLNNEDVLFSYPTYQFVLDFPLVRWQDTATTIEEQQAIDVLRDWLAGGAQQATTPNFGLRPAASEPTAESPLFAAGIPYGIQLSPSFGQAVVPPARGDVQGLIEWVVTNQ